MGLKISTTEELDCGEFRCDISLQAVDHISEVIVYNKKDEPNPNGGFHDAFVLRLNKDDSESVSHLRAEGEEVFDLINRAHEKNLIISAVGNHIVLKLDGEAERVYTGFIAGCKMLHPCPIK